MTSKLDNISQSVEKCLFISNQILKTLNIEHTQQILNDTEAHNLIRDTEAAFLDSCRLLFRIQRANLKLNSIGRITDLETTDNVIEEHIESNIRTILRDDVTIEETKASNEFVAFSHKIQDFRKRRKLDSSSNGGEEELAILGNQLRESEIRCPITRTSMLDPVKK